MVASQRIETELDVRVANVAVDRLLEQVAAGDREAFDQLYFQYRARVYGVVVTVLRDQAQAQEVTQEVFLQLWQQASRFDACRGSTSTWIAHLAHSRAVDRVRQCQTAATRDTRYATAGNRIDYDTVIEQVLHGDERAALRDSLQLNVNRSTVKTRIRDGLKKLAADLQVPTATFA